VTSPTIETDEYVEADQSRAVAWMATIAGVFGLLAATILTVDKINLLQDKVNGTFKPLGCDLNAFVSCSAVMDSDQAHVFGFANSIIGIATFAAVLTLGVLLLAKVQLPEFVWIGLQAGVLFGIGFVTWLQSQSIYQIEKLCPWCMVVWAVTIPLFILVTARNLRVWSPGGAISRFVNDWTLLIVILWYVAVIAAIWFKFGSNLWA
jgi:uncharacterized membrane protein